MAHTTLSVLQSENFPQTFTGALDHMIGRVTEIYDKHCPSADFSVENHGSIFLLRPLTEIAEIWVREFLPDATFFGFAVAVEHGYIDSIVEAIVAEGFEVKHG